MSLEELTLEEVLLQHLFIDHNFTPKHIYASEGIAIATLTTIHVNLHKNLNRHTLKWCLFWAWWDISIQLANRIGRLYQFYYSPQGYDLMQILSKKETLKDINAYYRNLLEQGGAAK